MKQDELLNLIQKMQQGSQIALAKLLSLIENYNLGREILPIVHKNSKRSYTIGITGPPGVGKSTLTEKLVLKLRSLDLKVGILAIDPTSPFSGGAILGDRIRLQQLSTDPQVFIRSMASRGHLGGISAATLDAAKLMEAYNCDYIIIETVGVGQSEVDIVQHVDTTLLILSPGQGDDIQAMKAGVMEIADIFVVNKADREGAERTIADIEMGQVNRKEAHYFDSASGKVIRKKLDYIPPIVATIAKDNKGIDELFDKIEAHQSYLNDSGMLEINRKNRLKFELLHRINNAINEKVLAAFKSWNIDELVDDIYSKSKDSYTIADEIIDKILSK